MSPYQAFLSVDISQQNDGILHVFCKNIFFKKNNEIKPTSQNGIVDFQTLQHGLRVDGQRKHWFVILQKMNSQLKSHKKANYVWFPTEQFSLETNLI